MSKRILSLFLSVIIIFTLFAACGSEKNTEDGSKVKKTSGVANKDVQTKGEKPLIKYAVDAAAAERQENEDIIKLMEDNGFKVEQIIYNEPEDGEPHKMLISIMAGDRVDLMYGAYSNMKQFYNAGIVEPMEPLAKRAGYDLEGKFGTYLMKFDGQTVAAPAFVDIAVTFYNKKIFDDAGVPYPDCENWTWDKYIETAKKLTNTDKGIYGSFMPYWVHYNYMYAMQKGAKPYKQDGTSNVDDPLFKESVKFYYDLGNLHKIQFDYLTQKSKQIPVDYFMSGKVGMTVMGSWVTALLTDYEKFPRDWKFGMLPMPIPEGSPKSTSTVLAGYWVPTTAEDKQASFKAATLVAEEQYKLNYGKIPARIDLTDEEIEEYISGSLIKSLGEKDGLTVEEIKSVWFDPEMISFPEKIVGTASVDINNAFVEECGLYGIGEQDLDTTMKNIKERADKAIKTELENK